MRRPEDIHSMIDYLQARGERESDVAILRWVLEADKSEWERKYDEAQKQLTTLTETAGQAVDNLTQKIATQDAEIRRLKSEPDHK